MIFFIYAIFCCLIKSSLSSFPNTFKSSVSSYKNEVISIQKNYQYKTTRPLIGILTQPSPFPEYPKENYSHIPSAYIRDMEAGGARVIAIKYDEKEEKLINIFKTLNGLLLPGGGTNIRERNKKNKKRNYTQYGKTAKFLIKLAINENKKGNYFPVWGTCLGFELILLSFSGGKNILNRVFGMVNHIDNLNIVQKNENTRLFKDFPSYLWNVLEEKKPLYFNHKNAVHRKVFYENKKLMKNFNILSLNEDHEGNVFISSAEHKSYPIYGVQFHPEKNSYDWQEEIIINRSLETIMIQQFFANFFVNEARKNGNENKNDEQVIELSSQKPVFKKGYGMPIYFFKNLNFTIEKEKERKLNHLITIKNKKKSNFTKTTERNKKKKLDDSLNYMEIGIGITISLLVFLILMNLIQKKNEKNSPINVNGIKEEQKKNL